MNRRGFLSALATLAAGAALDPDFLKWEAGARKFFDMAGPRLDDWSYGCETLRRGDLVTIQGVFAVDPVTGLTLKVPQVFVITEDTNELRRLTTHPPIIRPLGLGIERLVVE